ncbi:MAG TPA: hypothetical protein VN521_08845 [Negativicutes bacterium]|nr:hypothetical protein [Negativicutes bacterium]
MLWIAMGAALFLGSFVFALACCKVSGDYSRFAECDERTFVLTNTKAERRLG